MDLSKELAEKIALRSMAVLDMNVNIMNKEGIIIGSGEYSRIGTLHEIALLVMEDKERKVVDEKNISKYNFKGVKPGINLPIEFQNQIVGVVGITGSPKEVQGYGEVLKEMVELTLERDLLFQEINSKKLAEENFYQRLLDENLFEKEKNYIEERARLFDIKINKPRCVLVINYDASSDIMLFKEIKNNLTKKNMKNLIEIVLLREEHLVLVISLNSNSKQKNITNVKKVSEEYLNFFEMYEHANEASIGVGKVVSNLKELYSSYKEAKLVSRINKKLHNKKLMWCKEIKFDFVLSLLDKQKANSYCKFIFDNNYGYEKFNLANSGEIAENLVKNNLNIAQTSKEMHLHRNTLEYRLKKIEKHYGINLKNLNDLISFVLAYHLHKFFFTDG